MSRFNEIRQWAHDRNLIEGSDRFRQMVKLVEEQGELAAGIAKGNEELVADSIGDNKVEHKKWPSYIGVTVCDEWRSFMKFREWWLENHVDGWQIDKDLLTLH